MPPVVTKELKESESASVVYYEKLTERMRENAPHGDLSFYIVDPKSAKSKELENPNRDIQAFASLVASTRGSLYERVFHELRLASSSGWRAQTSQPYIPINITDSLEALQKDMAEVKESVKAIEAGLSNLTLQSGKIAELAESMKSIVKLFTALSREDFGWLKLSEQSFDFWDNPEDAIYDNL